LFCGNLADLSMMKHNQSSVTLAQEETALRAIALHTVSHGGRMALSLGVFQEPLIFYPIYFRKAFPDLDSVVPVSLVSHTSARQIIFPQNAMSKPCFSCADNLSRRIHHCTCALLRTIAVAMSSFRLRSRVSISSFVSGRPSTRG